MAAGTAIGAAPRAWAWVVLGGSIDDLGSPEAKAAIAMLVVVGRRGPGAGAPSDRRRERAGSE